MVVAYYGVNQYNREKQVKIEKPACKDNYIAAKFNSVPMYVRAQNPKSQNAQIQSRVKFEDEVSRGKGPHGEHARQTQCQAHHHVF